MRGERGEGVVELGTGQARTGAGVGAGTEDEPGQGGRGRAVDVRWLVVGPSGVPGHQDQTVPGPYRAAVQLGVGRRHAGQQR